MDREVMIQYSGPYLIQTTEAIMMGQTVESLNIVVDRGALLEEENLVNVYQQEERQCLVMPGIRKMHGKLEVKEERRDRYLFQIEYEQLDNKEVKECLGKLENHQELVYIR